MTVNSTRRSAYRVARVLGDVQAVHRGRMPQRAMNRLVGRTAARILRAMWR